jgi:hypothetical protein
LRAEGRTALLAIQTVTTEARGTGFWNADNTDTAADAPPNLPYTGVTTAAVAGDNRFQILINESGTYGGAANVFVGVPGITGVTPRAGVLPLHGIRLDDGGNVVGLHIANTVGNGRDSDNVGPGILLVGRDGNSADGP